MFSRNMVNTEHVNNFFYIIEVSNERKYMKRLHQLNVAILNAWPNVTFIYDIRTYGVLCHVAQVCSMLLFEYLLKNEIIELNEHLAL